MSARPLGCYVKVNPGFLEMTGYVRDDVIGCSFHDIDVLTDAEKRASER